MLEWILNPRHVLWVLILLAMAMPVVAAVCYRITKRRRESIAVGISGILALVMWFAFNSIEDLLGLDSLAAMGLNALLFLGVGSVLGVWIRQK